VCMRLVSASIRVLAWANVLGTEEPVRGDCANEEAIADSLVRFGHCLTSCLTNSIQPLYVWVVILNVRLQTYRELVNHWFRPVRNYDVAFKLA
jgi:hypothetical protein